MCRNSITKKAEEVTSAIAGAVLFVWCFDFTAAATAT